MIAQDIEKAVKVLEEGGIVIFPTDTAFGIGCNMENEEAVSRLFRIRRRSLSHATPVLVDTVTMAQRYVKQISQRVVDALIEPYWPGALTIVLPCLVEKVPEPVRGGGSTLGVRIPNHPIPRAIMQRLGKPILGPSANFHGEKTPYLFESLDKELVRVVDFVVKGECATKLASTVIDCSQEPWKILRQGAVNVASIL
ncbi:MAG: hypothetical protein RLZZ455_928 [Candidatus Parcubacteria bacterium]|jgi:L-threonylcarbamoyladenylate synthase